MKKIISLVMLLLLVTGCSCKKEIYKFSSFSITIGGETTNYTCSKKDKEDSAVKTMCEQFEEMTITLKNNDTLVVNFPSYNMNDEEENYKIQDGYLYLEEDDEWMKFAKYRDNKIIIEYNYATVVLEK